MLLGKLYSLNNQTSPNIDITNTNFTFGRSEKNDFYLNNKCISKS